LTLNGLDFWRLADELSVVDAAILISGNNPEESYFDVYEERTQVTFQHDGFEAIFKALRNAIFSNSLTVTVGTAARHHIPGLAKNSYDRQVETDYDYDVLVKMQNEFGCSFFHSREINLWGADGTTFYFLKEPNWNQTTVKVETLKRWLANRGVFPSFFFPKGPLENISDQDHPRFAPKLACAMAAWNAIKSPQKNKSVKQSIKDWVFANGVNFGLANADGVVPEQTAEEIAKITNWNTKGGAIATPNAGSTIEEQEGETFNFEPFVGEIPF